MSILKEIDMDALIGCAVLNVIAGILLTLAHVFDADTKKDMIAIWVTGTVMLLIYNGVFLVFY